MLVATEMPAVLAEVSCLSNQRGGQPPRPAGLPRPHRPGAARRCAKLLRRRPARRDQQEERIRMSAKDAVLHVGIDLGTSQSSIAASNGERHVVDSFVGWPVDMVARKVVKKSVLIGAEALENRPHARPPPPARAGADQGGLGEGPRRGAGADLGICSASPARATTTRGSAPWSASRPRRCASTGSSCARCLRGLVDGLMIVSEPFAVAYGQEALLHTHDHRHRRRHHRLLRDEGALPHRGGPADADQGGRLGRRAARRS